MKDLYGQALELFLYLVTSPWTWLVAVSVLLLGVLLVRHWAIRHDRRQ